jgi:DNA end-binding protein Ku
MRTIWKGALSFGLVTIPVSLLPATQDRSISFNQLRASDRSRIGYQRVSQERRRGGRPRRHREGLRVRAGALRRLHRRGAGGAAADRPAASIEIIQFVPLEQIDPIYFSRAYYLAPEPAGAKAYGLLSRAMRDRSTVAICKITLRDKEHLATLRLRDDLFVLETMHWPDEIRERELSDVDVGEVPEPRPQEVAMAEMLIDSLTEDFDPATFTDSFREKVRSGRARQGRGRGRHRRRVGDGPTPVVDLTRALQASVEAARKRRSDQQAS